MICQLTSLQITSSTTRKSCGEEHEWDASICTALLSYCQLQHYDVPATKAEASNTAHNVIRVLSKTASPPHPGVHLVVDGTRNRCTRDDFIRSMELVSSSLPTPGADRRFENLVRGCWDIPKNAGSAINSTAGGGAGGSGTLASTSFDGHGDAPGCRPVKVVATHADGTMSIEGGYVRDDGVCHASDGGLDGLLSESQAGHIRRQLALRGVHALHIQLTKNQPETRGNHGTDEALQPPGVENGTTSDGNLRSRSPGHQPSTEDVRIARLGPLGNGGNDGRFGGDSGDQASFGLDRGLLR